MSFKMFYNLLLIGIYGIFSLDVVLGFNMKLEHQPNSRITRSSLETSIDDQANLDPEHPKVNRSLLDWHRNQMSLALPTEFCSNCDDIETPNSFTAVGNGYTKDGMQQITSGDVNDAPANNQDSSNQPEKPTKKPKSKNELSIQQNILEKGKSRRRKGMGVTLLNTVNHTSNTEAPESTEASLEDNITHSSKRELGAEISVTVSNPISSIVPILNASLTHSNLSTPQNNGNSNITSSSVVMLSTEAPSLGPTTVNGSEVHPTNISPAIPSAQPTVIGLLVLLTLAIFTGLGIWWGWWRMKRRQQERLRLQLLPVYNYDPADDQDDWENRLLGESTGLKPKDKVHFYSQ